MTPRDRVIRNLNHQSVDRAPRDLWLLHGLEGERTDEVAEINVRFPSDIIHLHPTPHGSKRGKASATRSGHVTDPWGCTWQTGPRGAAASLVESPLADAQKIAAYEPPAEFLEAGRFTRASRSCDGTMRFVLAWSEVRPLARLLALRGSEAATGELAAGNKELRGLLAKLREFFRREIELWAGTDVDAVAFGDELSPPTGQRLNLRVWRSLFKPLYREFCEILHAHDKFVFFHAEGATTEMFEDLVETGVDAIHAPLFRMDLESLAAKFRGQVTFWGEMDPVLVESPATAQQIRDAVLRLRRALDYGTGGVIAQCGWGPGTPLRNIAVFFEEWMTPLPVTA